MLYGQTVGMRSSLDVPMFHLKVWQEQQRAKEALESMMSGDVLGDTDSLTVDGDYFSVRLPNGGIFRGLLIEDVVRTARDKIAQIQQHEAYNYIEEG